VLLSRPEIEICFENATEEELQVAMEAAPNRRSYVRVAAIRAMYLGLDRESVCTLYNRSDRMLRLWIKRFNEGGIDALASRPRSGRPRKVKRSRLGDLLVPVLNDPSTAGEQHWTGVKLHGWLKDQLSLELGYSTTIRYLHELGYNLRVLRPWPERQDEEQRERFLEEADGQVRSMAQSGCREETRLQRRQRHHAPAPSFARRWAEQTRVGVENGEVE
jgi:transposase